MQSLGGYGGLLQCVAVRCSVLQCVVVCCSVLQCVVVCCSMSRGVAWGYGGLWMAQAAIVFSHALVHVVCCSVLQCVAMCCSVMQCVALVAFVFSNAVSRVVCRSAVCCSVLQCVVLASIVALPPCSISFCGVLLWYKYTYVRECVCVRV